MSGPDPKPATTTQVTKNELPAWVKREGEELFKEAEPLADRAYPLFLPSSHPAAQQQTQQQPAPAAPSVPQFVERRVQTGTRRVPNPAWNPKIGTNEPRFIEEPVFETRRDPNPAFQQQQAAAQQGGQQSPVDFETAFDVANQRVAPFAPEQLASFDLGRNEVGAWSPTFQAGAANTAAAGGPVGEADIARYMNPYTSAVIDPIVSEIHRQHNRDTSNRHADMAGRGSFLNEDRREVIDNLARESRDRVIAEVIGQHLFSGFSDALGQANTDKARQLSAGGQLARLAPMRQQLGISDIGILQGVGEQKRGDQQARTDLAYDEFTGGFRYPQENINWLSGVLSGLPYETTQRTTGQQLVGQSNPFTTAMGAVSTIGGLGLQAASMFSSEDLKTDKGEPKDVLERLDKTPVEAWRYKGDPTGQPHVGPYAEDWKRNFGLGDGTTINLMDMAGIALAANKELSERVAKLEAANANR